jgi:hypothetical protein
MFGRKTGHYVRITMRNLAVPQQKSGWQEKGHFGITGALRGGRVVARDGLGEHYDILTLPFTDTVLDPKP